jgi:hypothetical protein
MAGGFTSIYRVEGSPRIPGVSATYCTRLSRPRRGTRDRRVACPAEYFLGGSRPIRVCVQRAIGKFVAVRQLASHPMAVSHWERKRDEWLAGDD